MLLPQLSFLDETQFVAALQQLTAVDGERQPQDDAVLAQLEQLGACYWCQHSYVISPLAQQVLNRQLSYPQYLYIYLCNFCCVLEDVLLHPLAEIFGQFNQRVLFRLDDYIHSQHSRFQQSAALKQVFLHLLGYAMQIGIIEASGKHYRLLMDKSLLARDLKITALAQADFQQLFVDSVDASKNRVLLLLQQAEQKHYHVPQQYFMPKTAHRQMALNQILSGPAGTGKTYQALARAVAIMDGEQTRSRQQIKQRFEHAQSTGQAELISFHQSFSYEEFVEGIRVSTSKTKRMQYQVQAGIFKQMAQHAQAHPAQNHVLIIDEINRGNVSKIFGELLTLLEPSKRLGQPEAIRIRLPYSQEVFAVPNNLYLIGTMNSADRSLTSFDFAMRRRFVFEQLAVNLQALQGLIIDGIDVYQLMHRINQRIEILLGQEYAIGQAYVLPLLDEPSFPHLQQIMQQQLVPLLHEYFFNDGAQVAKVFANNGFVQERYSAQMRAELMLDEYDAKACWQINPQALQDVQAYIAVYQPRKPKSWVLP